MKQKVIMLVFILGMLSCKENNVDGIRIPNGLLIFQTLKENRDFVEAIQGTLMEDIESIKNLLEFPCGGGAYCYELGFVFSQIVYTIGDEKFSKISQKLNPDENKKLQSFLGVGLEYGDNDYNGVMDNRNLATEFPTLFKTINQKINE